jgi:DNA-binding NtrC family response regulator
MDPMEYLLSCDTVRLVPAADRRDWERRARHPMESLIRAAGRSDVPVLITAGKTRAKGLASQIHRRSGYNDRDLLVIDCALPPYRYEQELFQTDDQHTGTILLTEIGQLPPGMQLRLRARMTVEAVARPGGGALAVRLGARRLMASSSVRLFDAVLRGTFDRDLYYRLNTFQLNGSPEP